MASLKRASYCEADIKKALTNLAQAFTAKQPYEVLIIDCDLPKLNTLKLITLLRSKKKLETLKIIALYSQDNQTLKSKLDRLSTAPLAKPYDMAELQAAMAQAPQKLKSAA